MFGDFAIHHGLDLLRGCPQYNKDTVGILEIEAEVMDSVGRGGTGNVAAAIAGGITAIDIHGIWSGATGPTGTAAAIVASSGEEVNLRQMNKRARQLEQFEVALALLPLFLAEAIVRRQLFLPPGHAIPDGTAIFPAQSAETGRPRRLTAGRHNFVPSIEHSHEGRGFELIASDAVVGVQHRQVDAPVAVGRCVVTDKHEGRGGLGVKARGPETTVIAYGGGHVLFLCWPKK